MPTFAYPNATNFVQLMDYNNSVSNNMFGSSILVMAFAITFITLMGLVGGPKKAFVVASWLTFMLSIPLAAIGVVNSAYPIVLIALGCISLVPLFFGDR